MSAPEASSDTVHASIAALRSAIAEDQAPVRAAVRTASRSGRPVVVLRVIDSSGQSLVECDVYPLNSLRVEPLRPGPFRFSSADDAHGFVEEALLTLRYLGCDVN